MSRRALTFLVVSTLIVVGCNQQEQIDVEAAQEQFCSDVEAYIESIDQYGGLFEDPELTVGDVRDASDELASGLETVRDSAATFQEAVAADPTSGVDIEIVDEASIEAVEEAEAAFAEAADIERSTPVIEAGVHFSSAAYQLEVAWARLFDDAGCLDDNQRRQAEAQMWVSDYVKAIQSDFRTLGYYSGNIDGIYGPQTIAAVEAFQEANGLPVTGLVDPPTQAAVSAALGQLESAQVGALQAILIAAGYYNGEVDGQWSPEVEAALIALQEDLGVPATGVVDAATLRALEAALIEAGLEPEIPTTTAPTAPATTAPGRVTTTTAPEATTTTASVTTTTVPEEGAILDVLAETGQFTQFLAAVEAAGLTETLSGSGPFTVFAPPDAAFAAVTLPSDPEALAALVQYHVVEGLVAGFDLPASTSLVSLQGGEIAVAVVDGLTVLNEVSTVILANVPASNGVVHVVDAVLIPPS
jgi:peptidoglycan hydrolase-like protein with peptidoglycan-binding domain